MHWKVCDFMLPSYCVCEFTANEGRKKGNVLFNDALNTLYLRLYGIRHMIKDHSYSESAAT